jgi:glucuronate isomerase
VIGPVHPDRLLPSAPEVRSIARELFAEIEHLPIVSPHGHVDPRWFADDDPFEDPARLLVTPDHYLVRMLHSQGVPVGRLGVGPDAETDGREIWRTFAAHAHLFDGTPSSMWLGTTFATVFGIETPLGPETADEHYDHIDALLRTPDFRPRALYDRFDIEFLATTEGALDDLAAHDAIHASGWNGGVTTTFRPDSVTDPDRPDFGRDLDALGDLTGCDVDTWAGYLAALRRRRADFIARGATATDHGHPTAHTEDLAPAAAEALFARVRAGTATAEDHERFRGQMLTEMVRMSADDGLVTQLHLGVWRNHNPALFAAAGPDVGADIPRRVDLVGGLQPLLAAFGGDPSLTIVVFTLDESTSARELAPLAGHYPALRIGAPWWFHDSPEGMRRQRHATIETAGFANHVGFTDDTRAFLSIPARHDVARRIDAGFLASLVAEHRLGLDRAHALARSLTVDLAREVYRTEASRAVLAARSSAPR